MRYICDCPVRKSYTEEEIVKEREANKKKLKEIEKTLADGHDNKSNAELAEFIKQQIVEHFRDSAFNTCENQALNMLRNTEMDVHISPEAIPKRTMKPIPVSYTHLTLPTKRIV